MRYPVSFVEGDRVAVDHGEGRWAEAVVVGRLLVRDDVGVVSELFEVRYCDTRRTHSELPPVRLAARPYSHDELLSRTRAVIDDAASRVRWPVDGETAGPDVRDEAVQMMLAFRAVMRQRGLGLCETAQEELEDKLAESCLEALLSRTEPLPLASLEFSERCIGAV
jgi:hypothetical protein